MANSYDFKNLERELDSLEKKYDKFESSFDNTISPILSAKFNSREYGSSEIERKLNRIVSDAKSEINKLYSELVNGVRRYAHSSIEKIKSSARETIDVIDGYNAVLDNINQANENYSNQNYKSVLNHSVLLIDNGNEYISNYGKLLTLESEKRICEENLSTINLENYKDYLSYYDDAIRYGNKHIISSKKYLFKSSVSVLKKYETELSIEDQYNICIRSLMCYESLSQNDKKAFVDQYTSVYERGVKLFNTLGNDYYNNFMYAKVKALLEDSKYFKKDDINNEFFTDTCMSDDKVFRYIKEYGSRGKQEDIRLAFEDSKTLANSDKREAYFDYWFSSYDEQGWLYCEEIINMQENRYSANEFIFSSVTNNVAFIKNIGDLVYNVAVNYYEFLKANSNEINLDDFYNSTITINSSIKKLRSSKTSGEDGEKLRKAFETLDRISYGMMIKNAKYYSQYDETKIKNINTILDDSSNRLYKKPRRRNLIKDNKKPTLERLDKYSKLYLAKSRKDYMKLLIISGVIGLAVIAATVAVIIIILK